MITLGTKACLWNGDCWTKLKVKWKIQRMGKGSPQGKTSPQRKASKILMGFDIWKLLADRWLAGKHVKVETVLLDFVFSFVPFFFFFQTMKWFTTFILLNTPECMHSHYPLLPIGSVTVLKNSSLLASYEDKSPANLIYFLL